MVSFGQPLSAIAQTPVITKHQGMGSIAFDSGTAFRVWTLFAKQVHVALYEHDNQDNDKPQRLVELASEGNHPTYMFKNQIGII